MRELGEHRSGSRNEKSRRSGGGVGLRLNNKHDVAGNRLGAYAGCAVASSGDASASAAFLRLAGLAGANSFSGGESAFG